MENNTFQTLPLKLDDNQEHRQFLQKLMEQVDKAFGERAQDGFVSSSDVELATRQAAKRRELLDDTLAKQQEVDRLAATTRSLTNDANSTSSDLDKLAAAVVTLQSEVESLTVDVANLVDLQFQLNLPFLEGEEVAPSTTYVQAEATTVAQQQYEMGLKVNEILTLLIDAEIMTPPTPVIPP